MARALSEKARALLQERRFAVLGTINKDGSPQLTTMWYLLDGDVILMNTKAGRTKERICGAIHAYRSVSKMATAM